MRRLLALVPPALAALLMPATPAYATDSVSATATSSGSTIQAQVSGVADDCGSSTGCTGQLVTLVVQPDATPEAPTLCFENATASVVAQQTVPATGGSFSVSGAITEQEGTYTVCGYVSATLNGMSVALAASSAFVMTLTPQPCSSATPKPLSLTAPTKLAYGRKGVVRVRDRIDSVDIETAVLEIKVVGSTNPFMTYAFTSADIASIEQGKTKMFSTRLARGRAPILISLLYQVIATTTCTVSLSAEITPAARPTTPRSGRAARTTRSDRQHRFTEPAGDLTSAIP